jgi:hypothetical protein
MKLDYLVNKLSFAILLIYVFSNYTLNSVAMMEDTGYTGEKHATTPISRRGIDEKIEESRLFAKRLDFKSPISDTECKLSMWAHSHRMAIEALGEWLPRVAGSPTNIAVSQVNYVIRGQNYTFHIPQFITSKTKLEVKSTREPITEKHMISFLSSKSISGY